MQASLSDVGVVQVMSVAWDETLGGQAFSTEVADILKKKSKQDPTGNQRAMAKLLAAAEKTKVVLSANKIAHPSIEGFIGDYDFKASIDRAEFEQASKYLLTRVDAPIKKALLDANMTADDIHRVEVIGGGWRIPKVQETLLETLNRKQLDKTMNSDEAFCFGAALYAASLSTAFRLRKFGVHDITSFAVSIDIDSLGASEVSEEEEEDKEGSDKEVKPILPPVNQPPIAPEVVLRSTKHRETELASLSTLPPSLLPLWPSFSRWHFHPGLLTSTRAKSSEESFPRLVGDRACALTGKLVAGGQGCCCGLVVEEEHQALQGRPQDPRQAPPHLQARRRPDIHCPVRRRDPQG